MEAPLVRLQDGHVIVTSLLSVWSGSEPFDWIAEGGDRPACDAPDHQRTT